MIKQPATRIAASILLVIGIVAASVLDTGETSTQTSADLIPSPESPYFRVSIRPDGIELSGHADSRDHETELLRVATVIAGRDSIDADFIPMGAVPVSWARNTIAAISLLTATITADLELTDTSLRVRGVTSDAANWSSKLQDVRKVLTPEVAITADVIVMDVNIEIDSVCARAYESFQLDPINFRESSSVFRRSALPRLDRLAALASTCTQSQLFITGHTDSTGDVLQNQRLSERRAVAVGEYLIASGIDADRLTISGAGSTRPIANTNTRYGRGQNRRIEVSFGPAAR